MSSEAKKQWLHKLEHVLKRELDPTLVPKLMEGSNCDDQDKHEEWLQETLNLFEISVGDEKCQKIMLQCGCHYNKEKTLLLQHEYTRTKDLRKVHEMLNDQMMHTLKDDLKLPRETIKMIKDQGLGIAGTLEKNIITVTKLPKSNHLQTYFQEKDPLKKRKLYCHCPHVTNAIEKPGKISPNFCYCGGGFYKQLWEEIIQQPVKITLLKSVIKGDDTCQFRVELPLYS